MGSQLDSVVRTIQVDFESLHVRFSGRRVQIVASGVEYIVSVIDAGIQSAEIQTTKGGPAGCESQGLCVPGRNVCGVKVVG